MLRIGSFGPEVTELQTKLNSLHFIIGRPTGGFGIKTRSAVKRLQCAYGLKQDGIVGPNTRKALAKNGQLSKHFHVDEFYSKGNGNLKLNQELITRLERLRNILDRPIRITPNGGYRDRRHNRNVGGVPKSQHVLGRAADIVVKSRSLDLIALRASDAGFRGIGIYHGDGFVHVDIRLGPVARW